MKKKIVLTIFVLFHSFTHSYKKKNCINKKWRSEERGKLCQKMKRNIHEKKKKKKSFCCLVLFYSLQEGRKKFVEKDIGRKTSCSQHKNEESMKKKNERKL